MKKNSQKIEEISKTISEIADQTSLLSLNAAIESARAGDHGKGFAVVADEISKLASMSIDSSKEIASIINNTVNNIEDVSAMIENLAQYLHQTIGYVKANTEFMISLKQNTERELEESKILYDSTKEVEESAQNVINETDNQKQAVEKIVKWFDQANTLGSEISGNLSNLTNLSGSLEIRSKKLELLIAEAEVMEKK